MSPAFIITVDTEGDNVWARARTTTTRNAAWLPGFQELAQRYGFRPTWLVNWEMAHDAACVEFLRDVLARNAGEVGLHLHAWDTPPLEPITPDDNQHHPFVGEYLERLQFAKLERLTGVLEDTFQQPMRSHRAGRWALNGSTVRWLSEHNFVTDCSVCPGVNWRSTKGDPKGAGGPDFRSAPHVPYYLDEHDVTKAASQLSANAILEVPMTIATLRSNITGLVVEAFSKRHHWLRPNGYNGVAMRQRIDEAVEKKLAHLMFMIHSSELMPGSSPTFPTEMSVGKMKDDLESLFAHAQAQGCTGQTVAEFAHEWRAASVQTV